MQTMPLSYAHRLADNLLKTEALTRKINTVLGPEIDIYQMARKAIATESSQIIHQFWPKKG